MKFKATGKHSLTLFKSSPTLVADLKTATSSFAAEMPNAKDIPAVPDAKDFFSFDFRHISMAIVGSGTWKATDFTQPGVLQASVPLLRNKPAYTNHYINVGNEIGHVGETRWVQQYTNDQGTVIPAGIEGPFVIDRILQPRLVRQLSSPVPPVNCASVTVDFDWEASHEFEREYDFYYHLGEEIDGTEVRRIATKITAYYESSLVWLGADPYAKMLVNGKVQDVNVLQEASGYSVAPSGELELYKNEHHFFAFDGPVPAGVSFSAAPPRIPASPPAENPPNQFSMNKELLAFLATYFGVAEATLATATKEDLTALGFTAVQKESYDKLSKEHQERGEAVTQLKADLKTSTETATTLTSERDSFQKERDDFKKEVDELQLEKTRLTPLAELGETHLSALRASAEKAYNTFAKGKPDQAILDELKAADATSLAAKNKMWGGANLSEFGATCTNCNSGEHIEMRSSEQQEEPGTQKSESYEAPMAQRFRR